FMLAAGRVLYGGSGGVGVTTNGCACVTRLERWLRDTDQWPTSGPASGDIAILNWDSGPADHAGIVERSLGDGRFASIEGNSDGRVARRERAVADTTGFGRVRAYLTAAEESYT